MTSVSRLRRERTRSNSSSSPRGFSAGGRRRHDYVRNGGKVLAMKGAGRRSMTEIYGKRRGATASSRGTPGLVAEI